MVQNRLSRRRRLLAAEEPKPVVAKKMPAGPPEKPPQAKTPAVPSKSAKAKLRSSKPATRRVKLLLRSRSARRSQPRTSDGYPGQATSSSSKQGKHNLHLQLQMKQKEVEAKKLELEMLGFGVPYFNTFS